MLSPAQAFDEALRAVNQPARSDGFDGHKETVPQYIAHMAQQGTAPYATRGQLEKAWRFAQLLDVSACEEALRGKR